MQNEGNEIGQRDKAGKRFMQRGYWEEAGVQKSYGEHENEFERQIMRQRSWITHWSITLDTDTESGRADRITATEVRL